MNNFKNFGIKPNIKSFVGDKISVKKLFNTPIKVLDFKIEPSKKVDGTECLTLQIEKSEEKRVVFTGSKTMIDQIRRVAVDALPFETTIKGDNEYYEFT